VAAVREQAGRLMHVANNYYMEPQAVLARLLSTRSFRGKCFFCNSGAEANEAALKLAFLCAGKGRRCAVSMHNSFHGRTLATVGATGQEKYQAPFKPLLPAFRHARLNDLDSVKAIVDDQTYAVIVEPIQGEGGVNVAEPDFLAGLRDLCDQRGMVLIFDEVQTGCGRTGFWFGYQASGVAPDIMTLAKGLGGGMAVGAIVARPDVAGALVPGTHASTFGGNPMACAGAIAAFEAIEEEDLLRRAAETGDYIMGRLRDMRRDFPFIREVRGRGCMIGVQLDRPGSGIVLRCLQRRMLINCTHDTVLRVLPSLALTRDEADEGLDILRQAMAEEA
jgi:acetylornithine/succinyldiaminopimelate/putrescine aminotransferase